MQYHVPLNNLSDVFERYAIETGLHNVILGEPLSGSVAPS